MAVTPTDVRTRLTEFAALSDSAVQDAIDEAERRTNRDAWGGKADDSVIYLTGHLLKVRELQSSLPSGAVASETVGPVSRSFHSSKTGTTSLEATAWGRMYAELRSTLMVPRF